MEKAIRSAVIHPSIRSRSADAFWWLGVKLTLAQEAIFAPGTLFGIASFIADRILIVIFPPNNYKPPLSLFEEGAKLLGLIERVSPFI